MATVGGSFLGSVNTSMDENVNIKANYTAKYMMEENSRKADIPLTVDSEDPMSISRLAKIHAASSTTGD